jgi:hypothetical protein
MERNNGLYFLHPATELRMYTDSNTSVMYTDSNTLVMYTDSNTSVTLL